jgi:hypothetical protein
MSDLTYVASFTGVTATAVQDLFTIVAGSATPFKLLWVRISVEGQSSALEYLLSFNRLTPTLTIGTGGTTVTPIEKSQISGRASTSTVYANNATTRATTTGTKSLLWSESFQVLNGYEYLPIPELYDRIDPGQALVIGLETAPTSLVINGSACWAEAV